MTARKKTGRNDEYFLVQRMNRAVKGQPSNEDNWRRGSDRRTGSISWGELLMING